LQPEPDDHPILPSDVEIKLLGGFHATRGGEPVASSVWRLRKGRELVKILALAPGHRLHREQLIEALWPDLDSVAGANNLHQVVHVARRALGAGAIELREELLTLRASVDVNAFEDAAQQARHSGSAGAHRAAMSLYSGELLPENRYEDWARERREELEALRAELEAGIGLASAIALAGGSLALAGAGGTGAGTNETTLAWSLPAGLLVLGWWDTRLAAAATTLVFARLAERIRSARWCAGRASPRRSARAARTLDPDGHGDTGCLVCDPPYRSAAGTALTRRPQRPLRRARGVPRRVLATGR
jgi:hypothetical protein